MNILRLIRLLIWRDIRRQRLLLFFLLASLIAMSLIGVGADRELGHLPVLMWLTDLLLILLAIRLIRADPPGREMRFLGGPPVPWIAVPLSKALFILLLLIMPLWIVCEFLVYQVGMEMRPADHVAFLIDTLTSDGWFLGGAVLVALFFRRTWLMLIVMLLGYVAGLFLALWANNFWYAAGQITNNQDFYLVMQCRELALEWGIGLAVVITAIIRYSTPRWLPAAITAFVILVAVTTLAPLWTYDFSGMLTARKDAPSSEEWKHVRITPGPASNFTSDYWPSKDTKAVYGPITVTGLATPFIGAPDIHTYHAIATLRSGRTIEFRNKDFNSFVGGAWEPKDLIPSLLGLARGASATDSWPQKDFEVFGFHPGQILNEDLKGTTIKGSITLEIKRVNVVGTIPFREGATLVLPRFRVEIRKIDREGGLNCDLTYWRLPLTLGGDEIPPWYAGPNLRIIIYKPGTGEYAEMALSKDLDYAPGTDTRITSGGDTFISTVHERYALEQDGDPAGPAGDWLNDAQMSFIATEKMGEIEVPYAVNDIDLGK